MSMMAVCPKCGAQNSPMNATCDICQAALGTALVDESKPPEDSWRYVWASMAISAGILVPCWLGGLGMVTLTMSVFYGPLIASYMARENQVWHAALGGVLALLAAIVLSLAIHWESTKLTFAAILNGSDATSTAIALVLGIPLLILSVLPISLTGASVGEHLCQWRRNRLTNLLAQPAVAISDDQAAKMKL